MGEREATVDLGLVGIFRCEKGVELFLGINLTGVFLAEG